MRTVHAVERTTRAVKCRGEETWSLQPVGVWASAGIRSVCLQPHATHNKVTCVCSTEVGDFFDVGAQPKPVCVAAGRGRARRRFVPFTNASRRLQGGRIQGRLRPHATPSTPLGSTRILVSVSWSKRPPRSSSTKTERWSKAVRKSSRRPNNGARSRSVMCPSAAQSITWPMPSNAVQGGSMDDRCNPVRSGPARPGRCAKIVVSVGDRRGLWHAPCIMPQARHVELLQWRADGCAGLFLWRTGEGVQRRLPLIGVGHTCHCSRLVSRSHEASLRMTADS